MCSFCPVHRQRSIEVSPSEEHYDEIYDAIIEKDYDKAFKSLKGMDKSMPEYPSSVLDRMLIMEAKGSGLRLFRRLMS